MTRQYNIGKCVVCNKEKEIKAKGKCKTCYNIENASKKPNNYLCPICNQMTQQYGRKEKCYKCYMKEFNTQNYAKNKEKIKKQANEYYYNNKDACIKRMNDYKQKNLESRKSYLKQYFLKNHEKHLKQMSANYYKNHDRYMKTQMAYRKNRLQNDTEYYLKERLSSRIRMAILNHKGKKNSDAIKLLGADITTVRQHLESRFLEGMTWSNRNKWHIDHIIPCDSFDLTLESEQCKCFHYTNLQPLWSTDNIKKGTKLFWTVLKSKPRKEIYI